MAKHVGFEFFLTDPKKEPSGPARRVKRESTRLSDAYARFLERKHRGLDEEAAIQRAEAYVRKSDAYYLFKFHGIQNEHYDETFRLDPAEDAVMNGDR